MLVKRKEWLQKVADNVSIINREDSLQRIAAMPEDERKSFVKGIVRELRKKQGLKDEPLTTGSIAGMSADPQPLFSNSSGGKGEWYFYNPSGRQKGQG
jgi:hypothetical protein